MGEMKPSITIWIGNLCFLFNGLVYLWAERERRREVKRCRDFLAYVAMMGERERKYVMDGTAPGVAFRPTPETELDLRLMVRAAERESRVHAEIGNWPRE
jgi:hypothetical protein